jgi:hypothetical protein
MSQGSANRAGELANGIGSPDSDRVTGHPEGILPSALMVFPPALLSDRKSLRELFPARAQRTPRHSHVSGYRPFCSQLIQNVEHFLRNRRERTASISRECHHP